MANPSITHLDTVSSRYILKSSVTPNFSGLSWEPKDTEGVTRKLRCAWRGLIQMGRHFQGGWTVFFFSWNGLMLPLNDLFEIKYANNGMNICLYGMLGSWKEKKLTVLSNSRFFNGWSAATVWMIDNVKDWPMSTCLELCTSKPWFRVRNVMILHLLRVYNRPIYT